MKYLFFILSTLFINFTVSAHGGHEHSSAPSGTSKAKFAGASDNENPFAIGVSIRSGYEFGSYVGVLPTISSFFGGDELGLNLNYEFLARQFNDAKQTESVPGYEDRDFNNHFTAQLKKSISEKLNLNITGEYELNQAVKIARSINDYSYYAVNSNLIYKLENEWSLTAGFLYGMRQYPNGTYLVPSSSPSGAGEPIVPNQQTTSNEPITLAGVTDNINEVTMLAAGDVGTQTLGLEGKYIINNSDISTRRYNGQALKAKLEKMLIARIFAQISFAFENRTFSDRSDKINTTELGLQKELSARVSVLGIARNTQLISEESSSLWEGYAQLQYVF